MIKWLETHLDFERHGANWTDEIIAGLTTFITMAYILFVNPNILGEAGMPKGAVLMATAWVCRGRWHLGLCSLMV